MSYDGKLMRRAMVRFEEAKQRRADALHARERAVYAAVPRIAEIDAALRETMSKLISSALRRGTDPRPAIEALKEENLALQRERAELLVAHGYPADYLEDKPNCPLCGDTGWRGSEVCSCLNDYYARVQLEELSRLLDLGTQSFETFLCLANTENNHIIHVSDITMNLQFPLAELIQCVQIHIRKHL